MLTKEKLGEVAAALQYWRGVERPRLLKIRARLRDEVGDIYVPADASAEYRLLVEQSRFPVLPLARDALAQALFVDGYRPTGPSGRAPSSENSPVWDAVWQPNRMDQRQKSVHKSAISYGFGYVTVLPGDPVPVVRPYSPFRLTAVYDDEINDPWPKFAMTVDHADALNGTLGPHRPALDPMISSVLGSVKVRIFDATHVYTLTAERGQHLDLDTVRADEHGLGVCPVVRFLDSDDADGEVLGKIEPLIPLQRQLNQTTFGLMMTQQFQAFRQRWVTGMAIERDADGNVKAPWNAAVNAVWANTSPDGRFGDFAETNLDGYLNSRDRQLMFISAIGQVPPHSLVLGAGISNISAEALAALGASSELDKEDHKTTFGEAWEQVLRLGGLALGGDAGLAAWEDTSAQVVWRDTTPRSLAQIADALGKLATLLEIPAEALWERIPGVTDQDIARWREMAQQRSVVAELRDMVNDDASGDGGSETADTKAAADAMGVLIRSGVDPESAAAQVGLDVDFTGAVPVSLRLPEDDAAVLEAG